MLGSGIFGRKKSDDKGDLKLDAKLVKDTVEKSI